MKFISVPNHGGRASVTSRLARGLGKEGLDNLLQVGAPTFRALRFLGLVFFDGQHLAELLMAVTANVFVERHNSSFRLMVRETRFQTDHLPAQDPCSPSLAQHLPEIARKITQRRKEPALNKEDYKGT